MPGESQELPASAPDPSVRTKEDIAFALSGERDYTDGRIAVVLQRLDGMDRATELLSESVTRVPTQLDEAIQHLASLVDGRFDSVALQFRERDTRGEREARDNTLKVDAAFAAQEKSAAKQDESNAKAMDKLEANFSDQITKQQDLSRTENKALADKIDDIKKEQSEIKQQINGAIQNRAGGTESTANLRLTIASLIGIALFIMTAAGFVIALTAE